MDKTNSNVRDLLSLIQAKDPSFQPHVNQIFEQHEVFKEVDMSHICIQQTELPPLVYDLYPILPHPGLMMLFAATGVGKTYYALNLAMAIASGGRFLAYQAQIPKRVIYIDGEMSLHNMQERLRGMNGHYPELIDENFFTILSADNLAKQKNQRLPKISEETAQQSYERYFKEMQAEVVVFDNLSTLAAIEENSATEWQVIQDWFCHLRAIGISVICVHHTGKNKDSYRGSSRMLDIMNTAILLKHDENVQDQPLLGKYRFTVEYEKHRDFTDHQPIDVFCRDGNWHYQNHSASLIERIMELIHLNQTQRQIAQELGISQSKVNRLLKKQAECAK